MADEIRKAGRHGILLSNLGEEVFSLLFAGFTHSSGTAKSTKRAGMHFHKDRTLSELRQNKSYGFQKMEGGGHLAAHEKWFINGQRLEVGNSYVYMGYMLTTKISVSTSLEPTTLKAKTK